MLETTMAEPSIGDQLRLHQLENEKYFAACAFTSPQEVSHDYGWLSPTYFCDERIRNFWGKTLEYNGDAFRAANDTGLLSEVFGWTGLVPSTMRVDEYARAISEDHYFREVLSTLTEAAVCVRDRDAANLQSLLQYAGNMSGGMDDAYSTAAKVHARFVEILRGNNPSIRTYIPSIDGPLRGMFPGDLIIVAAIGGQDAILFADRAVGSIFRQKGFILFAGDG
jgi:hypothetical protein